jgi:hypothetical protein
MNRNPEHIETLLREIEFSQLTEVERELVLTHLTGESEYRNMQRMLRRVRETFQTEAAQLAEDADMKERVMLRFSQNVPKSEADQGILYACLSLLKRKPVLAFAGTLTLMVFLVTASVLFWPGPKPELADKSGPAEQPETMQIPAEPADHTEAEVTTKEKAGSISKKVTVPISTELTDNQAAGEAYDGLANEMPNEVNMPVSSTDREDVSISKSEENDKAKMTSAETSTLMKENTKNTERLREDNRILNQTTGTGKVLRTAPEKPSSASGKPAVAPDIPNETNSDDTVEKQIESYLWRKAQDEGKTDLLNGCRGKILVLIVTFQPDGNVKKCEISGVADIAAKNWIKTKMAEMPGLNPPKGTKQASYQIFF